MTERDVVPAGVTDLVGEDRRGSVRPLPRLVEEAVAHDDAPAMLVTVGHVGERVKARPVVLHGAAPHQSVEIGQLDDLSVVLANHVHVARAGTEIVSIVDRARGQGVVVAGQDDDGLMEPAELEAHEGDELVGHAVVIEQVAGDQDQIDSIGQGAIDDAPEREAHSLVVGRLLPGIAVAVAAEMNVGGVQDAEGASG